MKFIVVIGISIFSGGASAASLSEQNTSLMKELQDAHHLPDAAVEKVKDILKHSGYAGQGNPSVTTHPMTPAQCEDQAKKAQVDFDNPAFLKICGARYMAPLFDPKSAKAEDAKACIDQFEFPNVPCTYPVTWVRAREAQEICSAIGKRLCDAHEWEGGCAGSLEPPDYPFEETKGLAPAAAFDRMRTLHNGKQKSKKAWAYGPAFKKGICAQDSDKSAQCDPSGKVWNTCGTNTYPSGSFLECRSALGVYDSHGNAAEHMNLPTKVEEMTSKGSTTLGLTEMKGSWFIWDKFQAHQDWCRWRAPFWHGSRVMDKDSHHNYHLGFRCCKTLE